MHQEKNNILIIEDDEDDVFLVKKNINCKGDCEISHAFTLKEGLEYIKSQDFDVVLLDLNLPDSSGSDSIISIKKQSPNIPIIILTGSDDQETALKSLESGANDYLSKGEINKKNLNRIILYAIERGKLNQLLLEREEKLKKLYIELEAKNKQLLDLAITDPLTGLFNRRYVDETLDKEIAKVKRNKNKLFYIVIDVDNFKYINDTYGHNLGDSVLLQIATILKKTCRDTDVCGRFGGDEFIAYGTFSEEIEFFNFPTRFMDSIRNADFIYENNKITVTVSIGIAILDNTNPDTKNLFISADKALYKAKENGRNQIVGFKNDKYVEI